MRVTRKHEPGFWLALAAALLITGCSPDKPAPAATPPRAKAGAAPASAATNAAPAALHQSVFSVADDFRDPFFPNAKKVTKVEPSEVRPSGPLNVVALLQAGFQGVLGAGDSRLGLINNSILEAGRPAVIPVFVNGQKQEITVRVREVLPHAVVLDLPGQSQPVTITRAKK